MILYMPGENRSSGPLEFRRNSGGTSGLSKFRWNSGGIPPDPCKNFKRLRTLFQGYSSKNLVICQLTHSSLASCLRKFKSIPVIFGYSTGIPLEFRWITGLVYLKSGHSTLKMSLTNGYKQYMVHYQQRL